MGAGDARRVTGFLSYLWLGAVTLAAAVVVARRPRSASDLVRTNASRSASCTPTRSHSTPSNLSVRMGMRRFTRLTNGFSKKVENHAAMVSMHLMAYNFARPHRSLGKNVTPAMAAGVADHVWTCEEIAELLERPTAMVA